MAPLDQAAAQVHCVHLTTSAVNALLIDDRGLLWTEQCQRLI